MSRVTAPRAVFVDHPVGRTFGAPGERERGREILGRALGELPRFTTPGQIRDLRCRWSPDGSRQWEEQLSAEMLRDH
jgi:hypothetical protein